MKKLILIGATIMTIFSLLVFPVTVSAAGVGSNPVTLHVEVIADTISIAVTPADVQFGQVTAGATSAVKAVTITNNSTKAVNLTATSTPEFYTNNLRIDDLTPAVWGVTPVITLAIGATRNANLTVVIPAGTANGVIDGSVTFWAE